MCSTAATSTSRAFRPRSWRRWFPSTELVHIGDEVADGAWDVALDPTRPLALFDALRTDFSLARLKHYTGTPAEHFQHFVLFTNYVRYVDEFVRFAVAALRDRTAASPACRSPAACSSMATWPTPRSRSRRASGGGTRCRPIT